MHEILQWVAIVIVLSVSLVGGSNHLILITRLRERIEELEKRQ